MRPPALALALALAAGLAPEHALAQQAGPPSVRAPIEITADALEVQQNDRIAVFTGNVNGVQGDLVLRADRVTVHYAAGESAANAISLLEAAGKVFISTPAETAEGEAGTYDVQAGIITLTGSVILTRGENVLRGNSLVLNLTTGVSRVEGAAGAADGRVRGLFVPNAAAGAGQ